MPPPAVRNNGTALRIEVDSQGQTATIALFGEMDLLSAPEFNATFERVSNDDAFRHVVVDLRGLSFIDSTGMEGIFRADAKARRDGFNFAVVKGPPLINRIFLLTGADRRLVMVDEPDDLAPPT
jgi:anti-sigma B factor antagonist